MAGHIADETVPNGPSLNGHDALIVAAGCELGAPVVSRDGALTYEETKKES